MKKKYQGRIELMGGMEIKLNAGNKIRMTKIC
jgi:hypothetical protein